MVQGGSEFLEKTHRKAQTRIPCVAVLNFMWFLEGGSEVVQGGSYILHLPPIRKSVQTVGGFLANRGGVGACTQQETIYVRLQMRTLGYVSRWRCIQAF